MGVLIKGMEMPKSCITCPLCECRDECAYCEVGDKYLSWDWDERLRSSRNDHCSLTEVPPHGRLIDADALLAYENQHYEYRSDSFYVETRTIELAPTIIPAEEGA